MGVNAQYREGSSRLAACLDFLHLGIIQGCHVQSRANRFEFSSRGDQFGLVQQVFGGDATPVEAYATEGILFDHAGPESKLSGPYPRHVSARATANDGNVVLI